MFTREQTKEISIGGVKIGAGNPVAIQSMCNTKTADVNATVRQILTLEEAGCEIIRVTVPDQASAEALKAIKQQIHIPLVADIHFDYRMAIAAIENGADKIRINPGNLGGREKLAAVVKVAKERGIPIRVGVNGGSMEKELRERYGTAPEGLAESALRSVMQIEELDYDNIAVSIKASEVKRCVRAYELFAEKRNYPLHIGITEAGGLRDGSIKGAMGLGILLYEGLGDTLRVSLTADPVEEIITAKKLLQFMEMRKFGVEIVSCPTCGRTEVDLIGLAAKAEQALSFIDRPLRVAVMGCIVNGPGEARDADLGICGGKGEGLIIRGGEVLRKVPEAELIDELVKEAKKLIGE